MSADIFAEQAGDADLLAAIYDLEHDAFIEDVGFYRRLVRRTRGSVLDLGCGSGRLFRAFLDGAASGVLGVDGSPALVRRAEGRIAADATLASAAAAGRLTVRVSDARRPPRGRRRWIMAVGVLPHLEGPEDALRMFAAAASLLEPSGRLVIDDIGPAGLPWRDLPLSVDWERELEGRPVVRRSQLSRQEMPDGLRVDYLTVTDAVRADGTIARLPARYRLWYPSQSVLENILGEAGLAIELTYGSHDLEPLTGDSERRIVIAVQAHQRKPGAGEDELQTVARG